VDTLYDVIIIGGGPAGLSAAVYSARKLLKTLILTKDVGGQVTWAYDVENYLGFTQMDTADLVARFEQHVDKYELQKQVGVDVTRLVLAGKIKQVITSEGKIHFGRTVIIATGKRPKRLGVPGEKEFTGMGVAYCATCDAPLFAGLDVVVAGGGNSALEAALDLSKVANQVYIVSLTPLTGDQLLQDKTGHLDNIAIFVEHEVVRILGESNVEGVEIRSLTNGDGQTLSVSGIFVEIGLRPNSEMVVDTLNLSRVGEIIVDAACRTGLAGVFACGDVTDVPFKQIVVAAGEGAKAALSAYNYIMNQR
jgi:alkyl hydroperoxide reductase subunit F